MEKKKYVVYYNDEVNEVAEVFSSDTLEECKEWINRQLDGMILVEALYDNNVVNTSKTFFYEVYDSPIVDTHGSVYASDWTYNDAVYTTSYYYVD